MAAVALLLAVTALVAASNGPDDPGVSLTAAGPAAGGGGGEAPPAPPRASATPPARATATTTTTEPTTPLRPAPSPAPRADDPVVRPSTTVPSANATSPGAHPPAPPTPLPTTPAGADCPAPDVRVTVTTDKASYAPGETVRGSTTIENRSSAACLLPTRAFVRILDAAGKDVSGFAYTMEYRFPVSAEPGTNFSTPFTWDQKDCVRSACVDAPAGTYTVAADWTEGGPYSGRGSFSIRA